MKAIYIKEPWSVEIAKIEQRPLNAGEALIKIEAVGVCGSDIGAFRGTNSLVKYPRVIGHELAGRILSIPKDNPKKLQIGDRVVIDPYLYCNLCYPCSIGRTNCCNNLKVIGVHIDGGMADTFAHPANMLVKIPNEMSFELAAMAEPLTISLHGLHRLRLKAGEHVVIFGAGTIGLLAAMVAVHYGATPILVDLVEKRLAFAKTLGIDHIINLTKDNLIDRVQEYTNGRMSECVMEASGSNAAISASLEVVCHAGRIVFTGWPKNETPIRTDIITRKEIDILGARTSVNEFEEALSLISSKKVDVGRLLTKVVSVHDAPETLQDIEKNPGNYLKVIVLF